MPSLPLRTVHAAGGAVGDATLKISISAGFQVEGSPSLAHIRLRLLRLLLPWLEEIDELGGWGPAAAAATLCRDGARGAVTLVSKI